MTARLLYITTEPTQSITARVTSLTCFEAALHGGLGSGLPLFDTHTIVCELYVASLTSGVGPAQRGFLGQ